MTTAGEELMAALAELRALFPDWRMGQLVANLTQAAGRDREGAIWDMEDEELLVAARRLIERNRSRQARVRRSGDPGLTESNAFGVKKLHKHDRCGRNLELLM